MINNHCPLICKPTWSNHRITENIKRNFTTQVVRHLNQPPERKAVNTSSQKKGINNGYTQCTTWQYSKLNCEAPRKAMPPSSMVASTWRFTIGQLPKRNLKTNLSRSVSFSSFLEYLPQSLQLFRTGKNGFIYKPFCLRNVLQMFFFKSRLTCFSEGIDKDER